ARRGDWHRRLGDPGGAVHRPDRGAPRRLPAHRALGTAAYGPAVPPVRAVAVPPGARVATRSAGLAVRQPRVPGGGPDPHARGAGTDQGARTGTPGDAGARPGP